MGGVGPEAAEPGAVDAAVDEVDGGLTVEEQGGAGGEFAVDGDEVAGVALGFDGLGELFRAEDGVEADETLVGGQEDDGHGGGEEKVGGVGLAAAAKEVGSGAEEEHREGDGREWTAEEAHGAAGEVEDVAEREGIEVGIGAEEVAEGGAGSWFWGG